MQENENIFLINPNKGQDVGGSYRDGEKIRSLGDCPVEVEDSPERGTSGNCCDGNTPIVGPSGVPFCIVDGMGTPYPQDSEGCFIVDPDPGMPGSVYEFDLVGTSIVILENGSEVFNEDICAIISMCPSGMPSGTPGPHNTNTLEISGTEIVLNENGSPVSNINICPVVVECISGMMGTPNTNTIEPSGTSIVLNENGAPVGSVDVCPIVQECLSGVSDISNTNTMEPSGTSLVLNENGVPVSAVDICPIVEECLSGVMDESNTNTLEVSGVGTPEARLILTENGVEVSNLSVCDLISGCLPEEETDSFEINGNTITHTALNGDVVSGEICCLNQSPETLGEDPSGWTGVPGEYTNIYDDVSGLMLGYVDDQGVSHPIKQITVRTDKIELGKIGPLNEDGPIEDQHPEPTMLKNNNTICDARATLGISDDPVEFQVFVASSPSGPWLPITGSLATSTFTLPAGTESITLTSLIGIEIPAGSFVAERVSSSSSNSEELVINLWTESVECNGVLVPSSSVPQLAASLNISQNGVVTWNNAYGQVGNWSLCEILQSCGFTSGGSGMDVSGIPGSLTQLPSGVLSWTNRVDEFENFNLCEMIGFDLQENTDTASGICEDDLSLCFKNLKIDKTREFMVELGQTGILSVDGPIQEQHRAILPSTFGANVVLVEAIAHLATPSTSGPVEIQFGNIAHAGATSPGTPTISSTLSIPQGQIYARWSDIEGVYAPLTHLQERVSAPGVGASELVIQLFFKVCP